MALGPTQPPTEWVLGAHSSGVKCPGHEVDHSSPFSAHPLTIHPYGVELNQADAQFYSHFII
jgi:hypothetical protein